MQIWKRLTCAVSLALVCGLAACSSPPGKRDDAYWNDQRWDGTLLSAVQDALHYPVDSTGRPLLPVPYSVKATVGFDYVQGRIQDPKIVDSSGRQDLDAAFVAQVAMANAPKSYGSHAAEPHHFELELDMPTPLLAFLDAEHRAINSRRVYPRQAVMEGAEGANVVSFDYLDGVASNITIDRSSGYKPLDDASVKAVAEATLPRAPAWLGTDSLHMQVVICYSLGNDDICPKTRQVLQITNLPGAEQSPSPSSSP